MSLKVLNLVNPDFTATGCWTRLNRKERPDGKSYLSLSQNSQQLKPHHLLPSAGSCSGQEPGSGGSWLQMCVLLAWLQEEAIQWKERTTSSFFLGNPLHSLHRKRGFSPWFSNRGKRSWKLHYYFRSKFSNSGMQSLLEDTLEQSHNDRKYIF